MPAAQKKHWALMATAALSLVVIASMVVASTNKGAEDKAVVAQSADQPMEQVAETATHSKHDDDASLPGKPVYEHWCSPCHGHGLNMPGTTALEAKYEGALPPVLEDRTDLTPEMVKYYVRNGVSIMPFFRKTEISDADLKHVAAYLSNAENQ